MPHFLVIATVKDTGAVLVKGFEEHELDGARLYCNRLENQLLYNEICLFMHGYLGDYKLVRRYI